MELTKVSPWKKGAPIGMPKSLASLERAIYIHSLLESTTTGTVSNFGLNTRSQDGIKTIAVYEAKNYHDVL